MAVTVNTTLLEGGVGGGDAVLPEGVYKEGEEIPADRTLLFAVNGRQYTAPKNVSNRVVFRFLRSVRKGSEESGMADLLYETLGDAVMDALADEDLSDEEFAQVMKVIRK